MSATSIDTGATIDSGVAVRLLVRHERSLRSYLSLLMVSDSDADDLIQETSLLAWEKLGEFRHQNEDPSDEFRAWLYSIAKFKVLNLRRKLARQRRVTLSDQVIDELSAVVQTHAQHLDQRYEALTCCLGKLRKDQRELITLRYGSQHSVSEIADLRHRTSDAVYKSIQRIRRQLLDCVNRSIGAGLVARGDQ